MPSLASIVIPAHNEERRIRGLLETLSDPSISGLYDVYVVCNGCIDTTRQVAEEYEGITVVEIENAGKFYALNEGDRLAGEVYPRLYCDADVRISPSSLTALVALLTTEQVLAAGPTIRYGVERSTWPVRMYFRSFDRRIMTSWLDEHLTGRGLYGASRAARSRFKSFPLLLADDLFFDSQFALDEKTVAPDSIVTVWVPVSLRELIRAEVRVNGGNQEYRVIERDSGAPAEPSPSSGGRFEFRLGDRIVAVRSCARELRMRDVVPILLNLAVYSTARTILMVRKWRGLQIRWR